jgi:4-amino-4-deoxy-L-arabinose transferase-like glycosyltransferase
MNGSLQRKPGPVVKWAVILVVIGVLIRFGLWLWVSRNPPLLIQGDGIGYERIARNVIEGNGFSMDATPPYTLDMLRTPGYPLFLIGVYLAVGYRPEIVTLIQVVLSLITLYVAYRLAVHLFDARAAWIALALMAVDIGTIILANVTLTESLFMVLLLPATYCLFKELDAPRRLTWMAAAGVLLGFATLVRPVSLYLVLLLLPFVWWAMRRPWQEMAVRAVTLLVAFLLALSPWSYRNLRDFGSPNISLAQTVTITYYAKYLRASLYHTPLSEQEPYFEKEVLRELGDRAVSPVEMNNLIEAKARAEIMQHPVEYVALYAKSVALMLVLPNTNFLANILGILDHPTGLIADMRTRSLTENIQALMDFSARFLAGSPDQALFFAALVAEVLTTFLTYTLAIVGTIVGLRRQHKMTVVLLLVISGYFFVVTGPIGTGRYRLPAMPYLMMLAGYGFVQIEAWRQARRSRKLGASLGVSQ